MPDFNISPNAIIELRKLLNESQSEPNAAPCVRLYLAGLGHEGLDWGMAVDDVEPGDTQCDCGDFKVLIEEDLIKLLGGVSVDFVQDEEGGGFKIDALDPEFMDLSAGCGCGSSCGGCGGGCGSCGGGEEDFECGGGCGSCGGCGGDFYGCGCSDDDGKDEETNTEQ